MNITPVKGNIPFKIFLENLWRDFTINSKTNKLFFMAHHQKAERPDG